LLNKELMSLLHVIGFVEESMKIDCIASK